MEDESAKSIAAVASNCNANKALIPISREPAVVATALFGSGRTGSIPIAALYEGCLDSSAPADEHLNKIKEHLTAAIDTQLPHFFTTVSWSEVEKKARLAAFMWNKELVIAEKEAMKKSVSSSAF